MQNLKMGEEKGQILAYVLLFMVLGTLLITPLLSLMSSGMKSTNVVFNTKADELYAADSGIAEGQWRIKSSNLGDLANPKYTPYDYGTTWSYPMAQTYPVVDNSTKINGQNVTVTISNEWMPYGEPKPSTQKASNIINGNKLAVTGAADAPLTVSGKKIILYHIKFSYLQITGEDLKVKTIGAWLPAGYKYYSSSPNYVSSPETNTFPIGIRKSPSNPPISWKGNQAVLWTWSTPMSFTSIPGGSTVNQAVEREVTFYIELPENNFEEKPAVVGWMTTTGVDLDGDGDSTSAHCAWNADVKVFRIKSVAGSTTIESFLPQTETRKMQAAISGDYYATGNSLLKDPSGDGYHDLAVDPSYADVTADNIPRDANVELAFLYWSGWKDNNATSDIFTDNTSNFSPNWDPGTNSSWSVDTTSPKSFKGNNPSGKSTDLTLNNGKADLSGTSPGTAVISWDYWYTPNAVLIDQCSNYIPNWNRAGTHPYSDTAWGQGGSNTYFRGHKSGNPTSSYYNLTLANALNLLPYAASGVNITWKMWKEGSPGSSDIIYLDISNNNGSTYVQVASYPGSAISATTRPSANNFSYSIASTYLTGSFKMRFRLSGYSSSSNYCDLDDITIGAPGLNDGVDFMLSSDGINFDSNSLVHAYNGTTMTYGAASKQTYSYQIPDSYLTAGFRIKFNLVGFANYNNHISNINIVGMQADKTCVFKIGTTQVSLTQDGLPQEGGELTSSRSQIIPNYMGSNPDGYSYASFRDVTALVKAYSQPYPITDPQANRPGYARYTVSGVEASVNPNPGHPDTNYLIGYAGWSIVIIYSGPSTLGHQLYLYDKFINSGDYGLVDFNGNGGLISGFVVPPQIKQAVLSVNITSGGSGYTSPPAVSITGGGGTGAVAMAKLTDGRVTSVAVWNGGSGYIGNNLPVVFTSVDGKGSGAAATAKVGDELNAAKLTCFVGEGDENYQGDYVALNIPKSIRDDPHQFPANLPASADKYKLWDGTYEGSQKAIDDVWNGKSFGSQFSNGIDIDTLGIDPATGKYITWDSGLLSAGDTSAQVDMYTDSDIWNLIYVILSFRSTITTGGDLSYLIR